LAALAVWGGAVSLKQVLQQAEGGDDIRTVFQAAVARIQVGAA